MQPGVTARVGLAVLLGAAALGCPAHSRPSSANPPSAAGRPPFHWAMAYCDTPYFVPAEDKALLDAAGVDTLFVSAGTFSIGAHIALVGLQQWDPSDRNLAVHLVFRFDGAFAGRFAQTPNAEIEAAVAPVVEAEVQHAVKGDGEYRPQGPEDPIANNVKPRGIQFDFDCPEALLGKYVDLLHRLSARLRKKGCAVSVTVLPEWLESPHARSIARDVDFIVLKCYRERVPDRLADFKPMPEPAGLSRWMTQADALGVPFWVGLDSSERRAMYDASGCLVDSDNVLPAWSALRKRSFQLERAEQGGTRDRPAEALVVLRAIAAAPNGQGKNYRLAYALPTPALLDAEFATVRRSGAAFFRGVSLFRYPETASSYRGEQTWLSLEEIASLTAGHRAGVSLKAELEVEPHAWGLVDAGARVRRPPLTIKLSVKDVGDFAALPSADAVVVELRLDRPGVDSFGKGDFDRVETGVVDAAGRFRRTEGARASVVRFYRRALGPGEIVEQGRLQTSADGATAVSGSWAVRSPDGFEIFHGVIGSTSVKTHGVKQ